MKPRKYILTGGPGSGKSSILLALESQGEYIIREAAEDHIRLRQAQGKKDPWTEHDFQEKILELQCSREFYIPPDRLRVFIDRGVLDGLAYLPDDKRDLYNQVMRTKIIQEYGYRPYDRIFLIENLGSTEKTDVRREDQDEALRLENSLYEIYQKHVGDVVRIPAAPLEQRVKQVLDNVHEDSWIDEPW